MSVFPIPNSVFLSVKWRSCSTLYKFDLAGAQSAFGQTSVALPVQLRRISEEEGPCAWAAGCSEQEGGGKSL